ncbi:hypothetical protein [Halomontanus rarus]|uniref:hypothetical protein n=1 Tax=Halomontanus rarus TaxID=3034020 RepID=UPI0023E8734D|nr:hypothetical protein [Halovivax sp. TS33]
MSFTPVSWLAEQVGRVRVGGRQLGSRLPAEHVPNPILKALFWLIIVVLFLDEFLILAAVVGGPIAFAVLVGFGLSVWFVRRTDRGARVKSSVKSRVTGRNRPGYRTRRK